MSTIKVSSDLTPCVLIDISGSTGALFDGNCSILSKEIEIAYDTLKKKGVENAYIMFWNSIAVIEDEYPVPIEFLKTKTLRSGGGTHLSTAINNIPEKWYSRDNNIVDMYIVTDGEISDAKSKIEPLIRTLCDVNKVNVHILTVESNDDNYTDAICSVGNNLFKYIRECNLTKKVFEYRCYNKFHVDGFLNFYNPTVPDGFVPFGQKYYKFQDIYVLLKEVYGLIHDKSVALYGSNDIGDDRKKNILTKLAFDLSLTLYHIAKYKSYKVQMEIVDIMVDIFSDTVLKDDIKNMIVSEIQNHTIGKSSTFQEYRTARTNRLELAQTLLFENVKNNICGNNETFFSFPMKLTDGSDCFFRANGNLLTHAVKIGNKTFENGAYDIQGHVVPFLPIINNKITDETTQLCLRRWVNAIYSKALKGATSISEESIKYHFLTDMMIVNIFPVSQDIKNSYSQIGTIMLNEKQFNSEITDFDFLMAGNKPIVMFGSTQSEYGFIKLMEKCLIHSNIKHINPLSLWYAILFSLNNEQLLSAQEKFCEDDLKKDLGNLSLYIDKNAIFKAISYKIKQSSSPVYKEITCSFYNNGNDINNDYNCPISQVDTSTTGGYKIRPHNISDFSSVICAPKGIISPSAFQLITDDNNVCVTCGVALDETKYEKVAPKRTEPVTSNYNINFQKFAKSSHEKIQIDRTMITQIKESSEELFNIDSLDFSSNSYEFDCPVIIDTLNSKNITITSSEEFKQKAGYRYPFLKTFDFKNVCLAGGFCRSILLNQKLKDFDFFFHGINDDTLLVKRFNEALKNLLTSVSKYYYDENKKKTEQWEKYMAGKKEQQNANDIKINETTPTYIGPKGIKKLKFFMMYKPLFNVFEVIAIDDPKEKIGKDFNLNYFDKYKFNSLNKFDRLTTIDVKNKKVISSDAAFIDEEIDNVTKKSIENYFEDNDKTGINMLHRFQFVLCKYKSINDILNNFDLFPSRVAFTGFENDGQVLMTKNAHFAYKYMINVLNEKGYSHMFDNRVSKYFSNGFSIAIPDLDISTIGNSYDPDRPVTLQINELKFTVHKIIADQQTIIVDHDSNMEDKMKANAKLEKQCRENGIALYKSLHFASLVSVCRYVEANDINYIFIDGSSDFVFSQDFDRCMPKDDGTMQFVKKEDNISFVSNIVSRIVGYDWYGNKRKKSIVNNDNIDADIVTAIKTIETLNGNEKIIIYQSAKPNGHCTAYKSERYESIVFTGPSSKRMLKKYMELNPEYTVMVQILNDESEKRQFIPFKKWDDVMEVNSRIPGQSKYIYEIINSEKPSKGYLDIEWKKTIDEQFDEDVFLINLKCDIASIFETRYLLRINVDDILIASASSNEKHSYHVILNVKNQNGKLILFKTNKRYNDNSSWDLWYTLTTYYSEKYNGKIDEYVYSNDREFRTLYSDKSKHDKRPFYPVYPDDTINWKDYLITYYPNVSYENIVFVNTPNQRVFRSRQKAVTKYIK